MLLVHLKSDPNISGEIASARVDLHSNRKKSCPPSPLHSITPIHHIRNTMGKRAEQAKKRRRFHNTSHPAKPVLPLSPLPSDEAENENDSFISPEDLQITIETLKVLAENPEEMGGREMKDLKRGVHEVYRVLAEGATLGG
jgi:hypothetical protein